MWRYRRGQGGNGKIHFCIIMSIFNEANSLRLLHDVEFFKSRIIKIDGAGDIGDYLTNIIKDKSIAQKEDSPATVPNISKTSLEKPAHDTEANKS